MVLKGQTGSLRRGITQAKTRPVRVLMYADVHRGNLRPQPIVTMSITSTNAMSVMSINEMSTMSMSALGIVRSWIGGQWVDGGNAGTIAAKRGTSS